MPSFQIVVMPYSASEYAAVQEIKNIVMVNWTLPIYITSQNRPAENLHGFGDIPDWKWCKIVRPLAGIPNTDKKKGAYHAYHQDTATTADHIQNGRLMAEDIVSYLNGSRGYTPAYVMIDELVTLSKIDVQACADWLASIYGAGNPTTAPALYQKWGTMISAGPGASMANYSDALYSVIACRGIVCPEMYAPRSLFCGGGGDAALDSFFHTGTGRYNWLWSFAGSVPGIGGVPFSVLFGVTDHYLLPGVGETYGWNFMDRMFYRFRSTLPGQLTLNRANGGAGSWKWDTTPPPNNPGSDQIITHGDRDAAFRDSWYHYCFYENNTLRPGVGSPCV